MKEQNAPTEKTPDQRAAGRAQGGWGFWALWVPALAAVGALSYLVGAFAPLAEFTLPPAAMVLFGLLAGGVQGFALRQRVPPARRWIRGKLPGRSTCRVREHPANVVG